MKNPFNIFGAKKTNSPMKEAGVSGAHIVGGWLIDREKNPKLSFLQRSTKYEELMSNIAVVGAGVRYFTALGSSAAWSVEPAEGDSSEEYADFVRAMMDKVDQSWSTIVRNAMMYRYLGFSLNEMTTYKDEDGRIYFRSIENRPVRTIEQFDVDDNGTLLGFGQRNPNNGETLYIPRKKCLYVVDNLMNDSPAGLGIMRHVFESCERLQKLQNYETMAYAKDLRGIPVGRVPYTEINRAVANGEVTEEDAAAAISAMENLVRMSSKLPETGIMLDSKTYESRNDNGIAVTGNKQWDLELLQGSSPGVADIGKAIERIQKEIARVLSYDAQMLDGAGSNALSKDKSDNVYLTVNSAVNDVVEAANKDILPYLWKLNGFDPKLMPKLRAEDVNAKDAETIANVLQSMATAGAPLDPADEAINDVRNLLGISQADLEKAAANLLETEDV